MADIISVGTAVPAFCHRQKDILAFMHRAFNLDAVERRKLSFLYHQSAIDQRYSVFPDFSEPDNDQHFLSHTSAAGPSLEQRMAWYQQEAAALSVRAVHQCLQGRIPVSEVTHLITVSCTGLSAPGLDLELTEMLGMRSDIFRSSVNFMGCYAAIHALKLAKMICDSTPLANVLIVATEICTIHFQPAYTPDNAGSSLLFGDGSAAVLVSNQIPAPRALRIVDFYAQVAYKGKQDMSWQLSSHGFLMRLSGYIPQLIEEDIAGLVGNALKQQGMVQEAITHWCVHPGGRKILDCIEKKLALGPGRLAQSRQVLQEYGNMSSPTILFVLKQMLDDNDTDDINLLGIAFGPGLTMETFLAKRLGGEV